MAIEESLKKANRLIVAGGPLRGKSTLASMLADKLKLTHLCSDPQRLLPLSMNGTPDDLDWGGENGVGRWVADKWLGRDSTIIEGCHVADAIKHWLGDMGAPDKSSAFCDRIIWLKDPPGTMRHELAGQMRQAEHIQRVFERLRDNLDNLEIWYAAGSGTFRRNDDATREFFF